MNGLTIQNEGVRIFLHAANTETEHAEQLERIYSRCKDKESPRARALWGGHFALYLNARQSVEELRHRGGLLHFMCAQVERTIKGEYVVRGAA